MTFGEQVDVPVRIGAPGTLPKSFLSKSVAQGGWSDRQDLGPKLAGLAPNLPGRKSQETKVLAEAVTKVCRDQTTAPRIAQAFS